MSKGFKIGFFDSGVGGLNVLYEAFLHLPKNTSFVYYADHDNVPYGNKSSGEIKNLLFHALRFLKLEGCDAIVIACNTASSVANKEFRASFGVPIIAMEPAIKPAIVNYPESRILITATQATIIGEKLKNLLDSLNAKNCDLMALPRLVSYAQAGDFRSAGGYLSLTVRRGAGSPPNHPTTSEYNSLVNAPRALRSKYFRQVHALPKMI